MRVECEWRHAWKRWSCEFEDFEKESVYIYIRVLVVTKSFFGYVLNQVQYNMVSAQYLG